MKNDGVIVIHDIFSDTVLGVQILERNKKRFKKRYSFHEFYDPKQEFKYGIGVVVQK